MKLKDVKQCIKCMRDGYDIDLKDTELMKSKTTVKHIVLTNRNNLNAVLKLLEQLDKPMATKTTYYKNNNIRTVIVPLE